MLDTKRLHPPSTTSPRSRKPTSDMDAEYRHVLHGLQASPPHVSPKWFYDAVGSALFETITRLPEYYPTRCELEIFDTHAGDMGQAIEPGVCVVELGSGSAQKIGKLLPKLRSPRGFRPIDVSATALEATANEIRHRFPSLAVDPVRADFTNAAALRKVLAAAQNEGPLLLFFPGSTLGNFDREAAATLLRECGRDLPAGTPFLLGIDLVKSASVLEDAYDDSVGVTAAFNRNLLAHLNRRFGSNFDPRAWMHEARWVPQRKRVEMWLRCRGDQSVQMGDTTLHFADGEGIHTENSHKWDRAGLEQLAHATGWHVETWWTDRRAWFAEVLLRRTP